MEVSKVSDLGTGSVALLKPLVDLGIVGRVISMDLSPMVVAVTTCNVQRYCLQFVPPTAMTPISCPLISIIHHIHGFHGGRTQEGVFLEAPALWCFFDFGTRTSYGSDLQCQDFFISYFLMFFEADLAEMQSTDIQKEGLCGRTLTLKQINVSFEVKQTIVALLSLK